MPRSAGEPQGLGIRRKRGRRVVDGDGRRADGKPRVEVDRVSLGLVRVEPFTEWPRGRASAQVVECPVKPTGPKGSQGSRAQAQRWVSRVQKLGYGAHCRPTPRAPRRPRPSASKSRL
eukprot:3446213-Prymnesium_polylepis.1